MAPQRSLLGTSVLVHFLDYLVSILICIDPGNSNPRRATSPKSSQIRAPRTYYAGCINPSYSSDIMTNTSIRWYETVQSGHVLPCIISSVLQKLGRYTSEESFFQFVCHIISCFTVPRFYFLLFVIRFRMDLGGILLSASDTTQESTQKLDCKPFLGGILTSLDLKSDSYQRIYFRNANHPMSRVSIVSRRQEGRSAVTYVRSVEQEEAVDAERR